ncbi:MAG: hypothetical protein LJF15_11965 [Acidobacteria bacterium]|jgi:hypothetical protein|nr:hypothetical protein [Acidobacteriota bacterium]
MSRPTPWAVLPALLLASSLAGATEVLPVDEVRAGMEGTGRTVFEGSRVEEFGVHILGVVDKGVVNKPGGPRQSMILARLEGGPLAETGVIRGMSGSPVFVDGKLVGAVAYSYPFGKKPIAWITPIGDMIEATRVTTPRATSARFKPVLGPGGLAAPLDREQVVASFEGPLRAMAGDRLHGGALPVTGSGFSPLALPLVFSGFEPSAYEWARGVFSSMGFAPVLGSGGAASGDLGPLPDLEPGAAVGISFIEGDLDLSATGTVTHIDQGRVYALGHPLYNLGPTQFPMKKAYVYSIFPSLQDSWKIAAAADAVGTVDQDRSAAIAGRLGAPPPMIESEVHLHSVREADRTFRFRIVRDELFTPVLAYVALLSVLQSHERALGSMTLRIDARLVLEGGQEVRVEEVLAGGQPAPRAAALVAGPLALLVANELEKVTIHSIDVDVVADEETRSATIERAWVDRSGRLRPGATTTLKVLLRTHRGAPLTHSLPLRIPTSASPGTYDLLVADAATFDALEQQERQRPFEYRDLDQLLRALNELRSGDTLYARLTRPGQGAIVGGEYLPALPASVLSVLQAPGQGASVVPLRTMPVWKAEKVTDYAVSGARRLSIEVER